MKVVLAFSGGLDTSFCVPFLNEERSAEVVTVTVDTGGTTLEDRERIAAQAAAVGSAGHHQIDARQEVYDRYVGTLIRGNVLKGEVYPLCVAAERTTQAIAVARIARDLGADAVAHGSTGAGNDQVRFDVAFRVLLPGLPIITPVRDLGLTREQSIDYLTARGLPVPTGSGRYSVNQGLWGTTLGGEWTHNPWSAPPADAYGADSDDRTAEPQDLVIDWREGLPVAIDGEDLGGTELVEELGRRAALHRIGEGIHIGETVLGIKGRIGFVAGAALVLIAAHRELEKLVLTRWQQFWKDHLARFFGERLHEGQGFDPVMRDIEALIASSQRQVSGQTRVRLATGRAAVTGVRSDNSLFDSKTACYGETHALWDGDEARAFAKISAIPAMLAARRGRTETW